MRRLEADGNVFLLLQVAFTELALTTFSSFIGVFFSSLLIGGAVGACSAMLHKYISITGDWDEGWVIDSALVLVFPYLAYTIAESANLSGIVAVLFCGMVMGRYTRQNLDKAPRMVTMCFFKLVAFLSETFVFIYMGSSMCTISLTHLVTAVISLLAIFLGRVANVFPGEFLLSITSFPYTRWAIRLTSETTF
jgi:NhaP-type Na+/H+ or K+/H+ antiporter